MNYKVCKRGLWDSTVPGISFDQEGITNYARLFDSLVEAYPRGGQGQKDWENIVENIKRKGKSKKYDCIIGVSGGTDSSYLMHLVIQWGLRPLAVHLDNGWSSEIAVNNIKLVTSGLNIDLETYVIDYEEMKDLLKSYMKASLPWIDIPTDIAIKSILYRIASREGIRYILRGNDFRTEGTQPREWTYGDGKQLKYINKKFGTVKLRTYPNYTISNLFYYGFLRGIKSIYPYYFIDYDKNKAQDILTKEYNWKYYGGHHHENRFTKFSISYWLYKKFNIDKRKISLSSQVLSGLLDRDEAIAGISKPPYEGEEIKKELDYVLKKLDLTDEDFDQLMKSPPRSYLDYPSYYPMMQRFIKITTPLLRLVLPHKPMAFYQMEMREKS